jgi:tRNA modification GTPase
VAGTTRDAVSVQLAFDGWPVELTDTAGLRDAEGLEAAGIERAKHALAEADLVVWVMDATDPNGWTWPGVTGCYGIPVINKSDLPSPWLDDPRRRSVPRVSATTGQGIEALVRAITVELVGSSPPEPGAAVPYTPELAESVQAARCAFEAGLRDEAARILREVIARPG